METQSELERKFWLAHEACKAKPRPLVIPYKKQPSHFDYKITETA